MGDLHSTAASILCSEISGLITMGWKGQGLFILRTGTRRFASLLNLSFQGTFYFLSRVSLRRFSWRHNYCDPIREDNFLLKIPAVFLAGGNFCALQRLCAVIVLPGFILSFWDGKQNIHRKQLVFPFLFVLLCGGGGVGLIFFFFVFFVFCAFIL